MKNETKLLSCPFCGGEAEFVRGIERKDIFQSSDYVYVRCKECHAQTSKIYYSAEFHKLDEEYALVEKAWNTRKPMERIVEQLEDMSAWKEFMIYDLTAREREIINRAIEIVKAGGVNECS